MEPIGAQIWTTNGKTVEVLGFHYPTRMAIIQLSDHSLFIWSPIAISEEIREKVDGIGAVKHIVAPNSLHHLSLLEWQQAYPEAKVYAPPLLRDKRKDIQFDEDLGDISNAAWIGEIDQVIVQGNMITTEVVFFHRQSGTVLVTDLIQNFDGNWFSGWRKIIAKLDLMSAAEPSVPRKFRMAFVNRKAARHSLKPLFTWPAKTIIMAHGAPVTQDAENFLQRAFAWLKI